METTYNLTNRINVGVADFPESEPAEALAPARDWIGSRSTQDAVKLAAKLRARASSEERILLFSDVAARNGAVESAWQVAQAMARSSPGQVLLIDADVDNPTLHERCSLPLRPGFTDALRRGRAETLAIHITNYMAVMPAGNDTDATALFSSAQLEKTLSALKKLYSCIIVVGPPVLESASAGLIGARSDEVVLIVTAGKNRRRELHAATRELNTLHAAIAGFAIYCG